MRGFVAICLGLGLVLGAGVALAQVNETDCVACECDDGSRPVCLQGDDLGAARCDATCAPGTGTCIFFTDTPCSQVVGCPQFTGLNAPTSSPYGIASVLVALGGVGAWQLKRKRNRALAPPPRP